MKSRLRLLLVALLAAAATLGWISSARADTNPSVSIGDVKAGGDSYRGVLTFRAQEVVQIDPKSVTATVDGKPVPITVESTSHLQRTALLLIDTSGSMATAGMKTVRAPSRRSRR